MENYTPTKEEIAEYYKHLDTTGNQAARHMAGSLRAIASLLPVMESKTERIAMAHKIIGELKEMGFSE